MHSAERTQIEVNVRSPLRVSHECTALVARIIGIAARPSPECWSVSTRCPAPEATASSASARMRASAACSAAGSPAAKVQSISASGALNAPRSRSNWALPTNGLSSTRISVCAEDASSTFLRLPNRVLRHITRYSRRLSIGGFVTWLKFWRKKWLSGRYFSDRTALGVSSPMHASVSLPSSAIGARICSSSSIV